MDGLSCKTLLKWMIWGYPYFRKHPSKPWKWPLYGQMVGPLIPPSRCTWGPPTLPYENATLVTTWTAGLWPICHRWNVSFLFCGMSNNTYIYITHIIMIIYIYVYIIYRYICGVSLPWNIFVDSPGILLYFLGIWEFRKLSIPKG